MYVCICFNHKSNKQPLKDCFILMYNKVEGSEKSFLPSSIYITVVSERHSEPD